MTKAASSGEGGGGSSIKTPKTESPKTETSSDPATNPFALTEGAKAFKETPEEAAYIEKAGKLANTLVKEWEEKLGPKGVKIAMGGSLTSGLALPGDVQDADIRFLFDGDRKALIPEIEKVTGLKLRKTIQVGGGADPISDAYMIEGFAERDGVKLEIEGALRTAAGYTGWQTKYKDVLSPEELQVARARKWELAQDKTGRKAKDYKAYKNSVLAEVQKRVAARAVKTDWDEDQPRDEQGRWSSSGGGGSAAERAEEAITGARPQRSKDTRSPAQKERQASGLKAISERIGASFKDVDEKNRLNDKERDFLKKFGKSKSDKEALKASGMSLNEAHRMANTIRQKMGMSATDNLRDVAKKLSKDEVPVKSETNGPKTQTSVAPKIWHGDAKGHVDTERAYVKNGKYPPERRKIHEGYAKEAVPDTLPKSEVPTFYMTGGGFAAGKTTALMKNPKISMPGKDKAAHISADDARHHFPEYKAGVAAGDPMAATFVQEEASYSAKQAIEKAIKGSHDVLYDSSGDSGVDGLEKKINQYRAWGAKRIVANYATLDVDEAVRRSDNRAKEPGPDKGRFIPHTLIRANHQNVAQTVLGAIERKLFDELDVWSNDSKPPVHLATFRKETGLKIHDEKGWQVFKNRADGKSS
jgi:hypothetical protein